MYKQHRKKLKRLEEELEVKILIDSLRTTQKNTKFENDKP